MSESYRNGAFALGIAVGGGLTLNLFLWLDYRANAGSNQETKTNSNPDNSEIGGYWDDLIRTFVSPSDTLAQWIMAIFTIAVVFLVWRTLVATQKMALDTQRIGEAQTRAYIGLQPDTFEEEWNIGASSVPHVNFELKNSGNSPAHEVNVVSHIGVEDFFFPADNASLFEIGQSGDEPEDTIMSGETVTKSAFGESYLDEDFFDTLLMNSHRKLCIYGIVFYKDVFDRPRETRFCYTANIRIMGDGIVGVTSWRKEHRHNDAT